MFITLRKEFIYIIFITSGESESSFEVSSGIIFNVKVNKIFVVNAKISYSSIQLEIGEETNKKWQTDKKREEDFKTKYLFLGDNKYLIWI